MTPCIYCGDPQHEAAEPSATCIASLLDKMEAARSLVERIARFKDDDKMVKSERELYAMIKAWPRNVTTTRNTSTQK